MRLTKPRTSFSDEPVKAICSPHPYAAVAGVSHPTDERAYPGVARGWQRRGDVAGQLIQTVLRANPHTAFPVLHDGPHDVARQTVFGTKPLDDVPSVRSSRNTDQPAAERSHPQVPFNVPSMS